MVGLKMSASKIISVQYRLFMDGHYLQKYKQKLLLAKVKIEAHHSGGLKILVCISAVITGCPEITEP